MTEDEFRAYIDAFNRDDYSGFSRFYTEDVVLVLGGRRELRGAQAITDFYRDVKGRTRRTIKVNQVIVGSDAIAAELESEFLALEDVPDLFTRPLKQGEIWRHVTFVIYDLEGGRFSRIRSARYQGG